MFEYNNIKVNYKEYGKKDGKPIIFLHGWGQNIEMMEPIANPFEDTHHLIIIDLPGFGLSDEPTSNWDLSNYVEMINNLAQKLELKNITIIGHSFGGKLAIMYALKYSVYKLVLLASPFKQKITKVSTKVKILKTLKKIPGLKRFENFAKSHMGSTDYKNASPIMRDILVKHVNTDLSKEVNQIKCPTLIIWGTKDDDVPYEDAKELESLIPDSGLVTYEGCTHYAYLERLNQTISVLKTFLN